MKEKAFELKITPKVEEWLNKISPDDAVFENIINFLLNELETNPYPRQNNPSLIKVIRGLKKNNPCFWRIKVSKSIGLTKEYRLYYSIVESNNINYVVAVDYSDINDNAKTRTVERLKNITLARFENVASELITIQPEF